jgi:hypothetical protein
LGIGVVVNGMGVQVTSGSIAASSGPNEACDKSATKA